MFNWRTVIPSDASALHHLEAACHEIDGEDAIPQMTFAEACTLDQSDLICATLAQQDRADQIIAVGFTWLQDKYRAVRGRVHPQFRRQGLGTRILAWTEHRAKESGLPCMLVIQNEAFNADCEPLYQQAGYSRVQMSHWMRWYTEPEIPTVPTSFRHLSWNWQNTGQFFQAYQDAFRERPGFPNYSYEEWLAGYKQDDDFLPDLSFLAFDGEQLVGFITSGVADFHQAPMGWIIQVGSHPNWRGRGVAAGLIAKVMTAFQAMGLPYVELHVNDNNPGARRVYEQLGFSVQGQRARYQKVLEG